MFIAALILLFVIPYMCVSLVFGLTTRFAADEYSELPLLKYCTLATGFAVGALLLGLAVDVESIQVANILAVEGPWRFSVKEFVSERASPLQLPGLIISNLRSTSHQLVPGIGFVGILAGLLYVSLFTIVIRIYGSQHGGLLMAISSLQVLICAYLVFYSANLSIWLINALNFWGFFVLVLLMRWPIHWARCFRHHA
jgi:hypothetical protein